MTAPGAVAARNGWLAEFANSAAALDAIRRLRARGYAALELYAPHEIPGAAEALGLARPVYLPRWVLGIGLLGALGGYAVQWYATTISFPLIVGGRPVHPAPAFVPITFELGILAGGFAALFGMLIGGRLGRLWQPLFEVEGFASATQDRYWVSVSAADPRFDVESARAELQALDPLRLVPLGEVVP